jgi:PPOX class probable F420-dependent enzyme
MTIEIPGHIRQFIDSRRVARLATVDAAGNPSIVPVCYVYEGSAFYSPIDEKPKRVAPRRLQRLRNIEVHPRVALLIDDYLEDWTQLAWVVVHGTAALIEPQASETNEHAHAVAALRLKYAQYRAMRLETRPVIRITAERVREWSAQEASHRDPA